MADPKQLILNFLSAVGHGVLGEGRDGEGISPDSTVWYIEAALNWSLEASEREFNDLRTDTLTITLPVSNGVVSASSVETAYAQLHTTVMGYTTDDQHVVIVDVQQAELNGSQLTLRVLSFIGSGYERDNPPSASYSGNDYRKFGLGGGGTSAYCVCGAQPAPAVRCMDKEIEYRINAANPPSSGYGFINVVTWTITTSPTNLANRNYIYNDQFLENPNDPGWDACSESLTCWWWSFYFCEDNQSCETPARQSYWTSSTWTAAMKIRQTHCPSKNFKVCTMGSTWWIVNGLLEPYYAHTCSFTYGNVILR